LMAEPGPRRAPGPLVRALGRAINSAVARLPWSWRLFSGPMRRFFDSVAVGWDEGVRSDSPEYLEPLVAALDRLEASPGRILDIGTGTGAALELADRYSDAEVLGINVSVGMVAQAGARAADAPTNPNSPPCSMVLHEARSRLREGGLDAALMDVKMSDGKGLGLVGEIHDGGVGSPIPTLVLTASLEASVAAVAMDAGARGALSKLAPMREAMDAIRRLTDAGSSEE
jgi:CheY-like chemotaxis protein